MSDLGQQLIAIVRKKAAERPDFVYVSPEGMREHVITGQPVNGNCEYIHADGQPGCLIGQALFEAGIIDASLRDDPSPPAGGLNQTVFSRLAEALELPIDQDELRWLRRVQLEQDGLKPWGEAVRLADGPIH